MGSGRAGPGREYSDFSLKYERTRSARCARSLVSTSTRMHTVVHMISEPSRGCLSNVHGVLAKHSDQMSSCPPELSEFADQMSSCLLRPNVVLPRPVPHYRSRSSRQPTSMWLQLSPVWKTGQIIRNTVLHCNAIIMKFCCLSCLVHVASNDRCWLRLTSLDNTEVVLLRSCSHQSRVILHVYVHNTLTDWLGRDKAYKKLRCTCAWHDR